MCGVQHVNKEAHLGFTEYEASEGGSIPNKMRMLFMAVDTLLCGTTGDTVASVALCVKTWLGKGRRTAHSTSGMTCQ